MIKLKVKKLIADAVLPTYATDGSGAFDLYAPCDIELNKRRGNKIPLGIAVEVPKGYVMHIVPRSSIGLKTTMRMSNSVGIIDSDYRGEIAALYDCDENVTIKKHERIAQGYLLKVPTCDIVEVDELSETERGNGGFGSTGA